MLGGFANDTKDIAINSENGDSPTSVMLSCEREFLDKHASQPKITVKQTTLGGTRVISLNRIHD